MGFDTIEINLVFAKLSLNPTQFQFRLRLALFPPWSSQPPTQPPRTEDITQRHFNITSMILQE